MDINSLDRFLEAQERSYEKALQEIKNGKKRSHWIWYIFPQLRGLGRSQKAYAYGINGLEEAKAYLGHPILAARLKEITEALLTHKGKDIYDIMGDIDDMKLHSSMTLFALISEEGSVFHQVIEHFYAGETDAVTRDLINREN